MVKKISSNALTLMLFFVNLMSSVDINIFKRFDLKMFAEKEKRNLDTQKVANLLIDVNSIN